MKHSINLLPTAYRRQQMIRTRIVQWGTILGVVLFAGGIWHYCQLWEDRSLAQRLEVLERQHAPTQQLMQELVKMRKQLEQLEQQQAVAGELERQRNALTLLGLISQTARQTEGRLRVTKLELKDFQNAAQGAAEPVEEIAGLVLHGVSLDNPAVGQLMDGLQDSGVFSRVELQMLKERETAAPLRDYEVRCAF